MVAATARARAALILLALLGAARASAGAIEGEVLVEPADLAIRDTSKPNPYVGQLSASARAETAATVDTAYGVAWVADPASGRDLPPPPARMDQVGQRFVPRILAVVAGQTVEFHNSDNVYHNIFSYSPPKRFDLGRYPKGKSRSVTFVKPGAVQVYCDIHSDMRADIIVAPSRRFALIGRSGRFRIEGVPAGTHTVKVWLPSSGERVASIDVSERGAVSLLPLGP